MLNAIKRGVKNDFHWKKTAMMNGLMNAVNGNYAVVNGLTAGLMKNWDP